MKLTQENLSTFLSLLPSYAALSLAARGELAVLQPRMTSPAAAFKSLDALVGSGFVLPPNGKGRCATTPEGHQFILVLRALRAHPVAAPADADGFGRYMDEHLDHAERLLLRNGRPGDPASILFRQITSPAWVEEFLEARNGADWERPYLPANATALLSNQEVFRTAQALLRWAVDRGGRGPLLEVAGTKDQQRWSLALHAAVRYGLLFVALDPATMDAQVGVWSSVAVHTESAKAPPPENVAPEETFDPGSFLMEDMTSLLIACATAPLPLRSKGGSLYAKTSRDLAAALAPFPKWVEKELNIDREMRLAVAFSYIQTFELANYKGIARSVLHVSPRGRAWLDLSAEDRLRVLIDGVFDRQQTVPAFAGFEGAHIGATAIRIRIGTTDGAAPDLEDAVMQPLRALSGDGYFALAGLLGHCATNGNPLVAAFRADTGAQFWTPYEYMERPDVQTLEQAWAEAVSNFVRSRLFPLGGARLGQTKGRLSLSITQAGRYYLGQTPEWQWKGNPRAQVVVQPNFDVTFLGESPTAEAEIGRFATRRGQRIGALFQITKKSIFAAAASGMTAEQTLAILSQMCSREVPGNVEREIRGWFAQCRAVVFEYATLIRCPDRETALRIAGMAKGSAVALGDTVLEYRDPGKQRAGLIKKLKDSGILVSVEAGGCQAGGAACVRPAPPRMVVTPLALATPLPARAAVVQEAFKIPAAALDVENENVIAFDAVDDDVIRPPENCRGAGRRSRRRPFAGSSQATRRAVRDGVEAIGDLCNAAFAGDV